MPFTIPDDAADILRSILGDAEEARSRIGTGAYTSRTVKVALKEFPSNMDAAELLAMLATEEDSWPVLNLEAYAEILIGACDELAHLEGRPIRFMWRKMAPVKNDRVTMGTAGAVSKSEREKWPASAGPAPWWRVTMSLSAWLQMTELERKRLMHHELACHCHVDVDDEGRETPVTGAHDIEEGLATMARFGLMDSAQAKVVAAAMAHPGTTAKMREYFIDPATGQGRLWPNPIGQDVMG